jgi:hypothetical protein
MEDEQLGMPLIASRDAIDWKAATIGRGNRVRELC